MEDTWDDVVVGAGSAGAVLAARLSERPDRRVLLLEAGTDEPAAPSSPQPGRSVLAGRNWDYDAAVGTDAGSGRRYPYCVGRTVGGSSAVNGAIALRALPSDFAAWAAAGNPEWAWDRVLPHFVRLETDTDFAGPGHGSEGPVPVRRLAAAGEDPAGRAFVAACRTRGIPELADLNAGGGTGVGVVPANWAGERRMSTAETHLAVARNRPNLTVLDGRHVSRVLVRRGRATGVEVIDATGTRRIPAGRVTLCAGAIGTPAILLRSGVGSAGDLTALGVRPVADLPGVGRDLTEHPAVAIWSLARPGVCRPGGPLHPVMARVAANGGAPDFDVFLAGNVTGTDIPLVGGLLAGRPAVAVSAVLLTPASRGRVFLRDPAPLARPEIVLGLASAPADLDRLPAGVRLSWSLVRSGPLAALLERTLVWTDRMVDDDALLRRSIAKFVTPMWHATGTARMGPDEDPMAVVDQYFRVRSVERLRVVDASAMPSIPAATPHLTCVMLAERAAGWMD